MGVSFNSRETYFDNLGNELSGCLKSEEVINLSGLNYTVEKKPIFLENGTQIQDFYCNVKSNDNLQLGIVGKNYKIVQNEDAFSFCDSLVENGATFETAGHFKDFKKTFVLAKTEPLTILGDKFEPYLLFANSFDGSGAVQAMFTPIRVICQNTLVAAIKGAKNKISIRHSSNVHDRLTIAKEILLKNSQYLELFKKNSEKWATVKVSEDNFKNDIVPVILENMGIDTSLSADERKRNKDIVEDTTADIMTYYNATDLQNYNNTAYKIIQAVADFESHYEPKRNKENKFIYMQRVFAGMVILNSVIQYMQHTYM